MSFKNPLVARFGKEFFSKVPRSPGVYFMKDEAGQVIYVGKAKVLRERLRSYTHANAENSSRKVLRLIHTVKQIEWETHGDEKAALLRENLLLRTLKPFFNVVNTAPHTYLFVHLREESEGIRIHLEMAEDATYDDVYGAFKGLGITYSAHKALLRLIWMSFNPCRHGFELPGILTNRKKLSHYCLPLPEGLDPAERTELYRRVKRFFNGTSMGLLDELVYRLLSREDLAAFTRELIQADIETLTGFYERCAKRNRRLKRELQVKDQLIAQEQVDDFLVMASSSKKTRISSS